MYLTSPQSGVLEAVTRIESDTRAAAGMHCSQPAAPMQVRWPDRAFGLAQFRIPGKEIHLSAAGRALVHCRAAAQLCLNK